MSAWASWVRGRRPRIYFPRPRTTEQVRATLRSFWRHERANVFAVYARRRLRFWSLSRADAEAWAHRYLYGRFEIRERRPRAGRD